MDIENLSFRAISNFGFYLHPINYEVCNRSSVRKDIKYKFNFHGVPSAKRISKVAYRVK